MKLYVASKVKYAPLWRQYRIAFNIISTWIDEAEQGATEDFAGLAMRCISEPMEADALILYCEKGDYLKYALIEVGAALAANRQIYVAGNGESISSTLLAHPNVKHFAQLDQVFRHLVDLTPQPPQP